MSILGVGTSEKWPWFPLLFITLAICYVACILPTELSPDNIGVTLGFSIPLIIFVYIVALLFVIDIVRNRKQYKGIGMFYGVVDIAFSLIHALALIMYCIVSARSPTNTDFSDIPVGRNGYALFWIHCLTNTVGFFFSAGIVNSNGVSGWGALHNMLTIVTGSFVTLFALALAVSNLSLTRIQKRRTNV